MNLIENIKSYVKFNIYFGGIRQMKRKIFISIIIILIVITLVVASGYRERNRMADEFIKINYSNEWRLLFAIIDDLNTQIFEDGELKNIGKDDILDIIKRTNQKVIYIDNNLMHYSRLNDNFGESIYSLSLILTKIEENIGLNGDLNEDEMGLLKDVIELSKEYGEIRSVSTYKRGSNPFTQMELPKEVKDYIEGLDEILDELNAS